MQGEDWRSRCPRQEPMSDPVALGDAMACLAAGYLAAHLAAT